MQAISSILTMMLMFARFSKIGPYRGEVSSELSKLDRSRRPKIRWMI